MPHTHEQSAALQDFLHLLLASVAAEGACIAVGSADQVTTVLAAAPPGLTGRRLAFAPALLELCARGVQPTADILLPSAITSWLGLRPAFIAAEKLQLDAGEGCLFFWWKQPPADIAAVESHVSTAARIVAAEAERKTSADQLQQVQDRMDVLLRHVSLGIVFVDSLSGSLLNSVAATILNLPVDSRDAATVVAAMQAMRSSCHVEEAMEETGSSAASAEYWISTTRGVALRVESHAVGSHQVPGRFWVFTDVKPLWDSKEQTRAANRVLARNLSMLGEEMDRRIEAEEELRKYTLGLKQQNEELEVAKLESDFLANQDSLTGLANRRRFRRELEDMVASARIQGDSVVVLFADLDKFKAVNDTLGHERGDQLLRDVAETLTGVLRKDDVISRLGGDEFACALHLPSSTPLDDIAPLVEKLRERLRFPVHHPAGTIHVSATIGLATFPDDADDAVSLLRAADKAMYLGKSQGGNGVISFGKKLTTR